MTTPIRYRSADEDSARWDAIAFRPGDVVISTRSKVGTTWVQAICAGLLLGQQPDRLGEVSPWVDHLIEPMPELNARLGAQSHRRFMKTHTPLDGIVLDPRATYLVVARHPLDAAVSLYHQSDNIDRDRLAALTGMPASRPSARTPLPEWLAAWATKQTTPQESMDSLVGHLHHASDAWARSERSWSGAPRVVLVHYADLLADLRGEVAGLADVLGAQRERVGPTVEAVGLAAMRSRATQAAPNALGVLKDPERFFRNGTSGEGRSVLGETAYADFEARCRALAPQPVMDWLLR